MGGGQSVDPKEGPLIFDCGPTVASAFFPVPEESVPGVEFRFDSEPLLLEALPVSSSGQWNGEFFFYVYGFLVLAVHGSRSAFPLMTPSRLWKVAGSRILDVGDSVLLDSGLPGTAKYRQSDGNPHRFLSVPISMTDRSPFRAGSIEPPHPSVPPGGNHVETCCT